MTIFIILAFYLVIIQWIVPESWKKIKTILAASGFVIVLALRSPYCGLDVTGTRGMIMPNSYGGVFLRMPFYSFGDILSNPSSVSGHLEIGWLLLTKTISLFTQNLQVYLAIIAIVQFIPVSYIIGKYSRNVVFSYFVFACLGFYIHYFSGIRQMLAVSFILLAFDQFYQKRMLWFVIIVLLTATIHSSSLLFLLVWPLSKIRMSFITALSCILAMIAIMPLYRTILSGTLAIFFDARYESYLESEGSAITMFIMYVFFLLLSFINKDDSPKLQLLRLLLLLGVGGQSLGVLGSGAITRIGYYFNIFLILMLPEIVFSFKSKSDRDLIQLVSIILFCAFFALTTNSLNSSGVIPYEFFWNDPSY